MRTKIHTARTRDLWMVLGLVALAVGLPAIVGVVSGAISIPRNDDFAYRRAATLLYETGRVELTGWVVMTLVGQLVATLPFLWLAHGGAWAFAATTATFAVVGIAASMTWRAVHCRLDGRDSLFCSRSCFLASCCTRRRT